MLKKLFSFILLCMFLNSSIPAIDFKVTDVIPVGPIYGGGLPPAQWSPDGTWLAYFSEGQLMIADSSGSSYPVTEIKLVPHRYRWEGTDAIILYQRQFLSTNTTLNQLIRIDIKSGTQTILEEYTHKVLKDDKRSFKGPYLTVEGNAFYYLEEESTKSVQIAPGISKNKSRLDRNYFIRTGTDLMRTETDALYLIRADFKDSIKISNKPYKSYMGLPMNLSPDKTHIMFGGYIVRLADDKLIILDTLAIVKEKPEGTDGCGFGAESFNPKYSEVVFRLTCDDGHSYVVRRIGVFDYITNEFTFLDSLIGIENCTRPIYAPDGKRIAFISEGVLYFLKREFEK